MRILVLALCFSSLSFAKIAPSFKAKTLDGDRIELSKVLQPGRAVFVSFWASWCDPCLAELDVLKKGLKKDPSLPLDVLAINVDTSETIADMKPTVKAYDIKFPIISDPTHEIFSKYQTSKELPFSVLVDDKQNIIDTFSGFHDGLMKKLKEKLDKLQPKTKKVS